jgi:hypothetical protein
MICTTEVALTCHMVIPGDAYLARVAHHLKEDVGIQHATLQIEINPGMACALARSCGLMYRRRRPDIHWQTTMEIAEVSGAA